MLQILADTWPAIVAASAAVAGTVAFVGNLLKARKTAVELKRLKEEKEDSEQLIVEPTAEEIARYSRQYRSSRNNSVLGILLMVTGGLFILDFRHLSAPSEGLPPIVAAPREEAAAGEAAEAAGEAAEAAGEAAEAAGPPFDFSPVPDESDPAVTPLAANSARQLDLGRGEVAWFKFVLNARAQVVIDVVATDGAGDPVVALAMRGLVLGIDDDSGEGRDARISFTLLAADYLVGVTSYGGRGGEFELRLQVEPASESDPAGPSASATGVPSTPAGQTLYDRGYTLYHQGHYVDAEASFRRFLQAYPDTSLSDNAQYWIGEVRFSRGDFSGALIAFREAAARYPDGNKVADSLLRAGDCLARLGNAAEAHLTYDEVMRRFPHSAAAVIATERRVRLP